MRALADHAKVKDLDMVVSEGGSHTKVQIGDKRTVVPRHNEINEITARKILQQMGVER